MRNRPSNQSKDNGLFYQSSHSREIRHVSRPASANCRSSGSSNQRVEAKQESYYEYVPSTRPSYEKPSLPYYVVPVLYVPQKVLSSEEIRPSSSIPNKATVNFLVKNQNQSRERTMIDVDKIPCIPCEIKKRSQKKDNCEKEEIFVNNINLDQPCTGYINAGYTQSSTSVLEDTSCQSDILNCNINKCASPVYVQCDSKIYKERQPARRCKPQVYQKFLQQQQKFSNVQDNVQVCQMPRSSIHLHWNPGRNCYETLETTYTSANEIPVFDCEKNQKVYIRRKKECSEQASRTTKPETSYIVDGTYYDASCSGNINCRKQFPYEDLSNNSGQHGYDGCAPEVIDYQDDLEYSSCEDVSNIQPDSTLGCTKATRLVKKMSSFIGVGYNCDQPPEPCCAEAMQQSVHLHGPPIELFTTEPLQNALGESSVVSVAPKSRKPKASQTTFDDVIIYSTYVATDHPIRDSKSTQTIDPATANITTSTQTNRAVRAFESCPPSYIDRIHEEVGIMVRPRARESSPSPTRCRRNNSPVKQSQFPPGDAKRLTIMKTAEMLQKPASNQSTSFAAKMQKTKRRKPRSPLSS